MEDLFMGQKEIIKGIKEYLKKIPDINANLVLEGINLLSLSREVDMLSEEFAALHGLSARQIETLEALFHSPEHSLTPAQLAEEVHLTRSAMTSNLDSLERKDYLTRSLHKGDRRMVKVTLTEKGVSYCEERLPLRYRDIERVISVVTKKERQIVLAAYQKVADFLRKTLEEEQIDSAESAPARS
jgi:DNA-binding MarR family transcriptional regulator